MEILLHFGLGLLGIFLYTLFKAKDFVFSNEFVFSTMVYENYKSWIWSAILILTLAVTVHIEPSLSETLRNVFAIDLKASPAGFFLLGATINLLAKPNKTTISSRRKKE